MLGEQVCALANRLQLSHRLCTQREEICRKVVDVQRDSNFEFLQMPTVEFAGPKNTCTKNNPSKLMSQLHAGRGPTNSKIAAKM